MEVFLLCWESFEDLYPFSTKRCHSIWMQQWEKKEFRKAFLNFVLKSLRLKITLVEKNVLSLVQRTDSLEWIQEC